MEGIWYENAKIARCRKQLNFELGKVKKMYFKLGISKLNGKTVYTFKIYSMHINI